MLCKLITELAKEAVAWGAGCSVGDQQLGDADVLCCLNPDVDLLQAQGVQAVTISFPANAEMEVRARKGKVHGLLFNLTHPCSVCM